MSVIDARVQAALASREPHETNPDALALIVRALDVDRARMARTHRFLNFLRQEVAQLSRWERGLFTSENGYEYDRGLEPFHKAGRELVARWHHIAERMEELLKHEE